MGDYDDWGSNRLDRKYLQAACRNCAICATAFSSEGDDPQLAFDDCDVTIVRPLNAAMKQNMGLL